MNNNKVEPYKKLKIMKKLMIMMTLLLAVGTLTARADDDRPISVDQLPRTAQQFIKQHFPNEKVAYAKTERGLFETKYEVVFTNSSKVEFASNGEWREVDCKYSTVPVAIIPVQITNYVKDNYPDVSVVQIDRNKRDYEVKLTNGLELTFDLKFNLIEIDD